MGYCPFFLMRLPQQGVGQGASKGVPPEAKRYPGSKQESSGPPITSPTIGPATMASGLEPIVAHTDRQAPTHAGGEMTHQCSN